ncbi:MAG TPA: hypothetical protein VGC97_24115 [Pyrinomonadaceae bacterium]|jgi:hypothetical protein
MKQIIFTSILAFLFSFSVFAQSENLVCPKIEVVGGGVLQPGELMSFSAKVSGELIKQNLAYEWKVSTGTILSGQGTNSIAVDTARLSSETITAEVKIKGLPENCVNKASETGSVYPNIPIEKLDAFGKLTDNFVKARIDVLYAELGNDPQGRGYIINYGTDKEIENRKRQIQKAIAFRKYDSKRVILIRGGANPNGPGVRDGQGVWTRIYIIAPGGRIPQP